MLGTATPHPVSPNTDRLDRMEPVDCSSSNGLEVDDGVAQAAHSSRAREPSGYQKAAKAAFLTVLRGGLSISAACRMAKIPRRTAYYWREQDDEFRATWFEAECSGLDHHEDNVAKAGKDDWRASEAFLKARRRDVWGTQKIDSTIVATTSVAVSGSLSVDVSAPDIAWLQKVLGPEQPVTAE